MPFKPEDGSQDSSGCAKAEPLPDTWTSFTCWLVAAACHQCRGQHVGGEGRGEVGRTQTARGYQGSEGAVRKAATAPTPREPSGAQAVQPSDLRVSTRPSQQEALESPCFPLSLTFQLLTSQSPPQPVLPTIPCVAPSGTVKQQDLRSLWTASSLSGQWQRHQNPPKITTGTTPSPNTPPLPWPGALRGGSNTSFLWRFVPERQGTPHAKAHDAY